MRAKHCPTNTDCYYQWENPGGEDGTVATTWTGGDKDGFPNTLPVSFLSIIAEKDSTSGVFYLNAIDGTIQKPFICYYASWKNSANAYVAL